MKPHSEYLLPLLLLEIHLHPLAPRPKPECLRRDVLRTQYLVLGRDYALHAHERTVHPAGAVGAVQRQHLGALGCFYKREGEELGNRVVREVGCSYQEGGMGGFNCFGSGGLQDGEVVLGDEVEGQDLCLESSDTDTWSMKRVVGKKRGTTNPEILLYFSNSHAQHRLRWLDPRGVEIHYLHVLACS